MQLLQDVFIVENLQVLTEGKTNPTMKIKGIFGRCNEQNNNGRVYPTAVLEGQLKKVQPMISERRLCGELDHPQNDTVKLSNASHLITKLEMKGDELIGEAEILNTPAGMTAKALVEGGVKIGISSRGMGTLSEDANGQKVVNEDFRLVTFDLVADPSTRGAFPGLSESTESQFVRESQDKLQKETNFVTMIEARLRDSYAPFLEEGLKKKMGRRDDNDGLGKKRFPDLNNDGETTMADVLVGRGVIPGPKRKKKKVMEAVRADGSWHKIAFSLAEAMGLAEAKMLRSEVANTRRRRTGRLVRAGRKTDAEGRVLDMRAQARADQMKADGVLRSHTEYQKIGGLMAEAMGLLEMDFNDPDMSPSEVRKTRYRRVSALERGNRMSRGEATEMKRDARVQSTAAEDAALKDYKLTAAREEDKFKKKRRKR